MQWLRTKIFATAALTMVCAAWLRLAYGAGPVSTSQSATSAACNAVQGDWSWFTGYVVSLKANHTILYGDRPAGTWECINSSRNSARLKWSSGFIDSISVSNDGEKISGVNNIGVKVSGNRRHPAPAPVIVGRQPAPSPQPGPSTNTCQSGNWKEQCQREISFGPYWTQKVNDCVMQKFAACGYLVH
jgi:hypothetical protein